MVALFSGSGGSSKVISRGKPHRAPVVHKAELTAAHVSNPPIPAKYRKPAKPKATTSPAAALRLPAIGKPGKGGGIATPVLGLGAAPTAGQPSARASIPHPTGPVSPYVNPFAGSGGVTGSRIDQGVDYTGKPGGIIGALGPGKIVSAQSSGSGWPGGGFIAELLSAGPGKGHIVYTAEDVAPTVTAGQTVKAGQAIGKFNQGGWIESGWGTEGANVGNAIASGPAYGQPTEAYQGGDPGKYTTGWGLAFNKVLTKLGAPTGTINGPVSGGAPSWASATGGKASAKQNITSPGRVSIPAVPAIPVVSGVNPPSSTPGGVAMPPVKLAAARTPVKSAVKSKPTGPPVASTGGTTTTSTGGTTITGSQTSSGGTITNITVPPDFIYSSGDTGGITYGTNLAQPVATGTTGASSAPGLGTLLLIGGGALLVVLLLTRKGAKPAR